MAQSNIEWTQMTWNPTTGCNKVSAGCKFCYAEVMSRRLQYMGIDKYKNGFDLTLHEESLIVPFTWKKPQIIFVNSMSDLFHNDVPLSFIKKVFRVMNETPHHIYQVLTKRSDILLEYSASLNWTKNIWMGVSVENEKVVHRIDDLIQTGALTKFLSIEPLIGPVGKLNLKKIDWAIVGGESGPAARPLKQEWIDDIRIQCEKQKVKFFFKQWGKPKFNSNPNDPTIDKQHPHHAKGGCELDGKVYREMPTVFA